MFVRVILFFCLCSLHGLVGASFALEALQGLLMNTREDRMPYSPFHAEVFGETMLEGLRYSGIFGRASDDPQIAEVEEAQTHSRNIHSRETTIKRLMKKCADYKELHPEIPKLFKKREELLRQEGEKEKERKEIAAGDGTLTDDSLSEDEKKRLNELNLQLTELRKDRQSVEGDLIQVTLFLLKKWRKSYYDRANSLRVERKSKGLIGLDPWGNVFNYGYYCPEIQSQLGKIEATILKYDQDIELLSYEFEDMAKTPIAAWIQILFSSPYAKVLSANRRSDMPFSLMIVQPDLDATNELIKLILLFKEGKISSEGEFCDQTNGILVRFVDWYRKNYPKNKGVWPEVTHPNMRLLRQEIPQYGKILWNALNEERELANPELPDQQIIPENSVLFTLLYYLGQFDKTKQIYYKLTSLMKEKDKCTPINDSEKWGDETYEEFTRDPEWIFESQSPEAVEALNYVLLKYGRVETLTPPYTPSMSVRLPGCGRFSDCAEMVVYDFFRFFLNWRGKLYPSRLNWMMEKYPFLKKNPHFKKIVTFFEEHPEIDAARDPRIHKQWTLLMSGLNDGEKGTLTVEYVMKDKTGTPRYEVAGGIRNILNVFAKILGGDVLNKPWPHGLEDDAVNRRLYYKKMSSLCEMFSRDGYNLDFFDEKVQIELEEISGNYCALMFFYIALGDAFELHFSPNHTDIRTYGIYDSTFAANKVKRSWKHAIPPKWIENLPNPTKFQFLDVKEILLYMEVDLPIFFDFYSPKYLGERSCSSFLINFFEFMEQDPRFYPMAAQLIYRSKTEKVRWTGFYDIFWRHIDSTFVQDYYPTFLNPTSRRDYVTKMVVHCLRKQVLISKEKSNPKASYKHDRLPRNLGDKTFDGLDQIMVKLMTQNGYDQNYRIGEFHNPSIPLLFLASEAGFVRTTRFLLRKTPQDASFVDLNSGKTAEERAEELGHSKVVDVFKKYFSEAGLLRTTELLSQEAPLDLDFLNLDSGETTEKMAPH